PTVADGHPRPRAGDPRGPGADSLEAAHGPLGGEPGRRGREAELVCIRLETGDLSQGPEIRLPGRAVEAPHGGAADEPVGRAVRRRVAGVLADDGKPGGPHRSAGGGTYAAGGRGPGPSRRRRATGPEADGLPLLVGGRRIGRLP